MELAEQHKLTENSLLNIQQHSQSLELYMEEFVVLSHLSWSISMLTACFWRGLDDELFNFLFPSHCYIPLNDLKNHVLWLNGSDFFVEEIKEDFYKLSFSHIQKEFGCFSSSQACAQTFHGL